MEQLNPASGSHRPLRPNSLDQDTLYAEPQLPHGPWAPVLRKANPALAKGECLIRQGMECRKYGAVKRWENVQADGL